MEESIVGFEACWLAQFCTPTSVHSDSVFSHQRFLTYLKEVNLTFLVHSSLRNSKNTIKSKHSMIRSIYTCLKCSAPVENAKLLPVRAVTISYDLHGIDLVSSVKLPKGYTKPLDSYTVIAVHNDVLHAHQRLDAKRKLALILGTKSTASVHISRRVILEIYSKGPREERSCWS